MLVTCRGGGAMADTFCLVFPKAIIPTLGLVSFILNGWLLAVLLKTNLPSHERKPFVSLSLIHVISALSVVASTLIGHTGIALHVMFTSLSGYLICSILIYRWVYFSLNIYARKMYSGVRHYIWLGFCAIFILLPDLSFFLLNTEYDPVTTIWDLGFNSNNKNIFISLFWYIHRFCPQVLILFYVVKLQFKKTKFGDPRRVTLLMQVLGLFYFLSGIPLFIRGFAKSLERSVVVSVIEIFLSVLSQSLTFVIFFFINQNFSAQVYHSLARFGKTICPLQQITEDMDSGVYQKGYSVTMDASIGQCDIQFNEMKGEAGVSSSSEKALLEE